MGNTFIEVRQSDLPAIACDINRKYAARVSGVPEIEILCIMREDRAPSKCSVVTAVSLAIC